MQRSASGGRTVAAMAPAEGEGPGPAAVARAIEKRESFDHSAARMFSPDHTCNRPSSPARVPMPGGTGLGNERAREQDGSVVAVSPNGADGSVGRKASSDASPDDAGVGRGFERD